MWATCSRSSAWEREGQLRVAQPRLRAWRAVRGRSCEPVGRSPETVRRWIRSGRLSAICDGDRTLIDPADLDAIRHKLYQMLALRLSGGSSKTVRPRPTGSPPSRSLRGDH